MISRIFKTLTVLMVAIVLTSCAKLPSSPANQLGPELSSQDAKESLYYSPAGPSTSSNQEQIINGFLYAGNGPQDDYAVARKFLTVNNSSKWHPSSETLIQTGQVAVLSNSGTKLRLLVNYEARVLADGTYLSEPGASRILEFRLLQENGQWRISSAPNLTSVLAPNFAVLFKPVPVYFWDKSFSYLVPDLRWFPTRASLATKLTNAMISGPCSWLAPAVQNILPAGTKLNINSVTVDAGSASIDFNATALKVPSWKRPYLRSQLLATLGGVDGITQVSISVERTVQVIGTGASGIPDNNSNLPIVLTSDGLSHLAGVTLFDIRGTKDLVVNQQAKAFAVSSDESLVVLLGRGKVNSYNLGLLSGSTQLIDDRKGLINPSIDPFNSIWTTSRIAGSEIMVTDVVGNQFHFPNPFGSKGVIREISLSQEGSRIAILHQINNGSVVSVFAVIRDKGRKVIGLGQAFNLSEFGTHANSISWRDHSSLVGLRADSTRYQTSVSVMLGGPVTVGPSTAAGTSVVSVVGGTEYYLDSDGGLFVSKSFSWERLRVGVLALRMAGQ